MTPTLTPRIALVHDYLLTFGGAERVLQELAAMFPEAPIYTLLSHERVTKRYFPGRVIKTSFLQRLPGVLRRRYRWLLPLYPVAVESLDLRDFDVVLSSSGAWSKGVVTRLRTRHLAYLHSPMRFAWDAHEEAVNQGGSPRRLRLLRRLLLSYMRVWDREAAERPDQLMVNSRYTQERVGKYYRRAGAVVYPPALSLFERFGESAREEKPRTYFLVVARLTRGKKIDLVIEAFNKLNLSLVVVGTGEEERTLRNHARATISFRGEVTDRELAHLYRGAKALIQPSIEDFGLVAAEAMSFGTPVIAYEVGGAKELVIPGKTGILFHAQTPEVIADGVRRFLEQESRFSPPVVSESVSRFHSTAFRTGVERALDTLLHEKSSV